MMPIEIMMTKVNQKVESLYLQEVSLKDSNYYALINDTISDRILSNNDVKTRNRLTPNEIESYTKQLLGLHTNPKCKIIKGKHKQKITIISNI